MSAKQTNREAYLKTKINLFEHGGRGNGTVPCGHVTFFFSYVFCVSKIHGGEKLGHLYVFCIDLTITVNTSILK